MLYDPKWEVETKIDPLAPYSLPNLIAWLETKDPAQEYCISIAGTCLLGQFAEAMGSTNPGGISCLLDAPERFGLIAFGPYADPRHTFGAALERARQQFVATIPR